MAIGLLGYIRTGSQVSLMSGLGFGFLLIVCSLAMFAKNKLGLYVALILTLFLTATFAYRYTVTDKTIPAILAVVSGFMLLFLFVQSTKWKNVQ